MRVSLVEDQVQHALAMCLESQIKQSISTQEPQQPAVVHTSACGLTALIDIYVLSMCGDPPFVVSDCLSLSVCDTFCSRMW